MAQITWSSSVIFLMIKIISISSAPTYLYHFCSNDTMFANNTQYQTNLNTLLHALAYNSTSPANGFYSATVGNTTESNVYGLFLCRGDQNATSCNDCVDKATSRDLPHTYCPNRMVAVIWYDECTVRYSNQSFFGRMDQDPSIEFWNDLSIPGNQTRFTDLLGSAMDGVAIRAANDLTGRKYATRVVNVSSLQTLYAMGECTPDLSPSDCNLCLRIAIGQLRVWMDESIMMPSCNIRYATYPFFSNGVVISSPREDTSRSGGNNYVKTIAIVVPVAAISVALFAIVIYHIRRKRAKKQCDSMGLEIGENFEDMESLQYDFLTLQSATNYFTHQNKLGKGGFGTVYKGTLANGQDIAVKRLSATSGQGVQEFKNEVLLLAKLHHRNLVRLFGFCLAGEEKLLVYEYVSNKSLDYFLFDPEKKGLLDWRIRRQIIIGVARGMLYLHQDSRLRIIHRDLKPSNILLDVEMIPKIADFGMAKLFSVDQTQENTKRVVGTYGYMSPEYAMQGQFSIKSDVYSFGVLLLEIICGKRNNTFYQAGYEEDLLSYAWKRWKDGKAMELVDPAIRDSCPRNGVMACIQLALLCVQQSANKRPTMATVVLKLDSHSATLPRPEKPGFYIKSKSTESNLSEDTRLDKLTSKSVLWSVNDISITEVEPR